MAEAVLLKPDRKFVEEIIDSGGEDLKLCVQCATCSVVCDLSSDSSPFPRKEMIWAQWGLKDRLMADPDVWLCHHCMDCSERCTRGAKPGDVLAAVREQAIKHYATPQFLAGMVNKVKQIPVMFMLMPGILLLLAILLRHPIEGLLGLGGSVHDEAFYASFFPHWLLIAFYTSLTMLAFVGLLGGLFKYWKAMKAADLADGRQIGETGIITSFIRTVTTILLHRQFGRCTQRGNRQWTHLFAFYGFIALFAVTVYAVFDLYLFPVVGLDSMYPFNLMHPMKILANIGGVLLIAGCVKGILDQKKDAGDSSGSTSFDQIFIWLLLLVGVTGFITEVFRFTVGVDAHGGAMQFTAYAIYFVHLMCVFGLLVYLPYSKFAHIWYRTLAMVYAEYSGRTKEIAGSAMVVPVATEVQTAETQKQESSEEASADESEETSAEESKEESEEEPESTDKTDSTQ